MNSEQFFKSFYTITDSIDQIADRNKSAQLKRLVTDMEIAIFDCHRLKNDIADIEREIEKTVKLLEGNNE